jgi:hypothetical protein
MTLVTFTCGSAPVHVRLGAGSRAARRRFTCGSAREGANDWSARTEGH